MLVVIGSSREAGDAQKNSETIWFDCPVELYGCCDDWRRTFGCLGGSDREWVIAISNPQRRDGDFICNAEVPPREPQ